MKKEDQEIEFDYSGHLIFNEVCQVSVLDESFPSVARSAETELLKTLPDFEQGSTYQPGSGYQRIPLRDHAERAKLPVPSKDFINGSLILEYRYEDFDQVEALIDGDRKEVSVPNEKTANIVWDLDGHMVFRGSETDASKAKSQTNTSTGDRVSIQSINFDQDFLLWLFERAHDSGELTDDLKISRLSDAEIAGSQDEFGGEALINDSDDIKQSDAILLGLLKGKHFAMLEGDFTLFPEGEESATIRTEVQREKIYVKASKAGLKNANKAEKFILSSHVAIQIVKLHEYWDNLPKKDKFVSPEFFISLIETCHERDIDLNRQPVAVLRTQAQKREESLDDYNFQLGFQ